MSTPTPTPRTCGELSCEECNARTAALTAERDQLRDEVERVNALGSWAHTCIHHNDAMRAACPVCLVAALGGERDRLRAEVEQLETNYADYAFWRDAAKTRANHLESASQQMLAYEDTILQLRTEVERLKTCGITELAAVNSSVLEYCKHWEARAERAEAELDQLSKVKVLLFDALEHYQNCVIRGGKNPARDAIAAALKEGAK